MRPTDLLSILDRVDSTNNYAMAALHAGMASHGKAWLAKEQFSGKGQRGKEWESQPGKNLLMSVAIEPPAFFSTQPFFFNMVVSNTCFNFLTRYTKGKIKIKWPNDLYISDRKAGGLLIENIYQGISWKWAVVGIGINVNQVEFSINTQQAISLKQVTGEDYDVIELARELQQDIVDSIEKIRPLDLPEVLASYNRNLYGLGQKVKLRKKNVVFETQVSGVNEHGQLLTEDSMPRQFDFGEVEWIIA